MSKAASASKLAELHEMLAEVLIDDLKQSKVEGIPLPAANLGVIRQFLKDNEITASVDSDDMVKLRDEFSTELEAKRTARKAEVASALQSSDYDYILQ